MKSNSKPTMKLIHPVYLDVPMLTAFIASLEDGIIEEKVVQSKQSNAKEKQAQAKLKGGMDTLLGFLKAEGELGGSAKYQSSIESQYSTTVKYPQAALFNKLLTVLNEQELIKPIESGFSDDVFIGDIIQLTGTISPNPLTSLSKLFKDIIPIFDVTIRRTEETYRMGADAIDRITKHSPLKLGDDEYTLQNRDAKRNELLLALDMKKQEREYYKSVSEAFYQSLPPQTELSDIVLESGNFKHVLKVYEHFARANSLTDLYAGEWTVLAKVIKINMDGDIYDLAGKSVWSYLKTNFIDMISASIQNNEVHVPIIQNTIEGKAYVLLPIAIYI
ncbi:MAG: hypothetical protein JNL32_08290 [Candidatus Kapabacteria bacterium]|nr:hypothetical protein [Candidatus Kapabacteria bacterium]